MNGRSMSGRQRRSILVAPIALAFVALGSGPAASWDGVYSGRVTCEAVGTSAGFTQSVAFLAREGRFASERGTPEQDGYERLAGAIAGDGAVTIEGRYRAEVEKPIAYAGRITEGTLRAEGRRGPRRCRLVAALPPPSGVRPPYRPAPDAAARRAAIGTTADRSFACPAPPAPVRDVLVEPFYRQGDPTHSLVDPAAYERRRQAAAPFSALAGGAARLGDQYLRVRPRDPRIAACLLDWLDGWASAGGMLGRATSQGAYERKWTLCALALNYGLLADAPDLESAARRRIEAWLAELAGAVVPPYAAKAFAQQNNHLHWAALAALAAAVATRDGGLFDWGIAAARGSLANIAADGSLPHELRRASKAMHYHRFALEPLILAAEIAAANGIDLYGEHDGALHRLAAFTRRALADPELVAQRVGVPQSLVGADAVRPAMYAFAEPYVARFRDPDFAALLRTVRGTGLSSVWLGGNLTLRYGLSELPR
jgi:poly(beta-D-mannuronate) lyase